MALKKCKECGNEVSSKGVCPKCGKDQRNFFVKHKVITFILIIIVLSIIAVANGENEVNNGNNTIPTQGSVIEQPNNEEIIEVDYNTLHKEYMDNPIAADAKYKGKILSLTGNVDSIDREIAGNTYITFQVGASYDFQNIRITFKKSEEEKVAQLKKGQTVTIKGKCNGTLLSTTVSLIDSEIIN